MAIRSIACAMLAVACIAVPAAAQEEKKSTLDDAAEVVTQPGRDIGIDKAKIPPILVKAGNAPYARLGTCAAMTREIRALNDVLGPDFGDAPGKGPSVWKTGGAAVVNTLIPFRGLVREVSGAAAADRKLAAATSAGLARRGFLRGVYTTRGCRTGM